MQHHRNALLTHQNCALLPNGVKCLLHIQVQRPSDKNRLEGNKRGGAG